MEMLLALALSAALLASIWTLFDLYTRLFDDGLAKVENSQLSRVLLEQISDDLHAAIQDPVGGSSPQSEGTAPVRRFGLSGSSTELRFDVLQVTPEQGNPIPVGQWSASGEVSEARVPELRTVYYSFTNQSTTDGVSRLGLMRRELDFETPVGVDDGTGFDDSSAIDLLGPETLAGGAADDDSQPDSAAVDPLDDSVMWVPEVLSVEFRYFDGNGWTSAWDSLQRKSLPVAVEVVLQVADSYDPSENQVDSEEDIFAEEEEIAIPDVTMPQGSVYRLIVDLPGSPTYREPRPPQRPVMQPPAIPAGRQPARISPTRIAPRRFPAAPSAKPPVRIAPEEWIRTQSR
ncbi:MAG: hypothetical protein H8E44_15285 [Planctomycetes bacterium]|nr:hypothetical protein [Planctomycetota bacterium]MBL7039280.1 hypothetical protein [Pirellulaceae bacterium]